MPERQRERIVNSRAAIAEYQRTLAGYLWEVAGIDNLAIAPFYLLATEGKTYWDRDYLWHMETLATLAEADKLFRCTAHRVVDMLDEQATQAATAW